MVLQRFEYYIVPQSCRQQPEPLLKPDHEQLISAGTIEPNLPLTTTVLNDESDETKDLLKDQEPTRAETPSSDLLTGFMNEPIPVTPPSSETNTGYKPKWRVVESFGGYDIDKMTSVLNKPFSKEIYGIQSSS